MTKFVPTFESVPILLSPVISEKSDSNATCATRSRETLTVVSGGLLPVIGSRVNFSECEMRRDECFVELVRNSLSDFEFV